MQQKSNSWALPFLLILILFNLSFSSVLRAHDELSYDYDIDLKNISRSRYQVELDCRPFAQDTLVYHFPWIIPGTYMEANYGQYIHKLKAYDNKGKRIKVQREGTNTFIITPANQIKKITYRVGASWDNRKPTAIWPMAGTGIIPDKVFAINAGGVFGYFQGLERIPISMQYRVPNDLYAMTVLHQSSDAPGQVMIKTRDYHELVDSPILFAYPDTASFNILGTRVLVGFAHETKDERKAEALRDVLKPSMAAIGSYIDSLPAKEYAFLIYYSDSRSLGLLLDNPTNLRGLFSYLRKGRPRGGALEHNKSSFYYLPDMGSTYTAGISNTIERISIHEFMHILTPLNLRSQYIDDWDYNDPVLSKHLWLYEGVTEYLSQIIRVNGGLITPKQFLLQTMRGKIRTGEQFPLSEMSFTEMSSHVLEEPYKDEFLHVYQRGAVMGMLLDIEIIRLTDGKKRLIDVMLELANEYGPDRPMPEDEIFEIFVKKVHPHLKRFFNFYVDGKEPLPYQEVLERVGVVYMADDSMQVPLHPIVDNDVEEKRVPYSRTRFIGKVGKKERLGLKSGDKFGRQVYPDNYFDDYGNPLPEGMIISLPLERAGKEIHLSDTIRYKDDHVAHHLSILEEMTPRQKRFYNIWLGIDKPVLENPVEAPDLNKE